MINLTLRYEVYEESAIFIDFRNVTDNRYYATSRTGNRNGGYQLVGAPQWPIRFFAGVQLRL